MTDNRDIDRRRDSRIATARSFGQELVNRGRRSSDRNALTNVDEEDTVARRLFPETTLSSTDEQSAPRARAFWQRCVESDDLALAVMLVVIALSTLLIGALIGYYLAT